MTLYEIDSAITNCIDPETGEVIDVEALSNLSMERDAKVESVALWYKNELAQANAIKDEEKSLRTRRKAHEKKALQLKSYLSYALNGQKFESARAKVTFRMNSHVETDGHFIEWAQKNRPNLLRTTINVEPDKDKIKAALKDGNVPHAQLVATQGVTVS